MEIIRGGIYQNKGMNSNGDLVDIYPLTVLEAVIDSESGMPAKKSLKDTYTNGLNELKEQEQSSLSAIEDKTHEIISGIEELRGLIEEVDTALNNVDDVIDIANNAADSANTAANTAITASSLANASAENANTAANNYYAISGYYTCSSSADSSAKIISMSTAFKTGISCKVKMTYANTAANVTFGTSSASYPMYYNGKLVSSSNTWEADEVLEVWYDGINIISKKWIGGLLSGTSTSSNNDFINVSGENLETLTLSSAISKVDTSIRKLGQVITFRDGATSWATYQFTGSSLNDWSTTSLWKNITGSGESGVDELKSQVDTNTADIASLKADVSTNAQDIGSLADEIDRNSANINSLQSSVTALETKEALATDAINGLKTKVSDLTSQVNTNTGNITSITSQVNTNTSNISNLNTEVSDLKTNETSIFDSLTALTTRVDDNTSGIRSLNTQVNALSDSLDAITNKVKPLTKEEYSLLDTPDPNTIYFIRG